MVQKVKSAWWIVYYIDDDGTPRFLLVKRHALSKKVERVAPKGKIKKWEKPEKAALREIHEEVGLPPEKLQIKEVLDTLSLQLYNDSGKLGVDKDITYFLVEYSGDPDDVEVSESEWFLGVYKRAAISDAIRLVEYRDLRELFREAHDMMGKINKRDEFIKNF